MRKGYLLLTGGLFLTALANAQGNLETMPITETTTISVLVTFLLVCVLLSIGVLADLKKVMSKANTLFIAGLLAATITNAENLQPEGILNNLPIEVTSTAFMLLVFLLAFILLLSALFIDLARYIRKDYLAKGKAVPTWLSLFGIFDGDSKAIVGKNADVIIEDHDYDGIQEFDNDLPPWWVYGFYITIIVAAAYMIHYQLIKSGPSQEEEYAAEMKQAELLYADVDLTYDKAIDDPALLNAAKERFMQNCATCHGDQAAGSRGGNFTAGPNLTDEYWIYGGNINNIYKTIKNGEGDGRMPAWKNMFNNQEIYELASYIKSLKGSKVDSPKDPQGEKYEGE